MPKISFFIVIISVIIGIIKSQYITLKFRTNLNLSTINEQNYMKSAVEQQIYVNLDIGQSNQVIPMTLKTMKYPTFIVSSKSPEQDILIKYNETKSEFFKYINNDELKNLFIYDFTQGYYVSDSLTLTSSLKYNNFTYILATKMNGIVKNISGEIGLSMKTENKTNYIYPQKTNFLQQLLDNKLINKKIFGIKYDSEYTGRFIIGATLKELDSSYKDEEPIKIEIDDNVPNNNKDFWLLKLKIQQKEYTETSYGFLQYETGLIFGSNGYRNNYIKNYFQSKGCSENLINSSPYSFYQYSCNNENQFSDFPDLNLGFEDQYNFTLTKNDLFKKIGNNYFFLVVFQSTQMDVNYWRLGQLFFKKYPMFLYQNEEGKNKQILYYTINKKNSDYPDDGGSDVNPDDKKNPEDNGSNLGLVISLSIIIPLIVIAVVIFVFYYLRKRRKTTEKLLSDSPSSQNDSFPITD